MRVVFFGSTNFSCLVLKALLASTHEIAAIVTQPDHRAGRRLTLCPTPVCSEAENLKLPVFKPERIKSNPELRRELRACKPDAFVLASFGQIISSKVLQIVEWPLGVHPSSLPKLRGASPARSALLNGLEATELCIMRMTPRLDDGDVLLREPLAIPRTWNFFELLEALGGVGGRLAVKALDQISDGSVQLTPQDHAQATYCGMYSREDTVINWARPASELEDFVRAWDPDVGALTTLPDGRRLKIWRARAEVPPPHEILGAAPPPAAPPGTVIAASKKSVWVATGESALRLLEVQPENKPRMAAANFLAGNALNPGERLGG